MTASSMMSGPGFLQWTTWTLLFGLPVNVILGVILAELSVKSQNVYFQIGSWKLLTILFCWLLSSAPRGFMRYRSSIKLLVSSERHWQSGVKELSKFPSSASVIRTRDLSMSVATLATIWRGLWEIHKCYSWKQNIILYPVNCIGSCVLKITMDHWHWVIACLVDVQFIYQHFMSTQNKGLFACDIQPSHKTADVSQKVRI